MNVKGMTQNIPDNWVEIAFPLEQVLQEESKT